MAVHVSLLLITVLLATTLAAVIPLQDRNHAQPFSQDSSESAHQPVSPLILWHGLGDAFDSDGIKAVGDIYRELFPHSFVYTIHLGDNGDADRHASFFGNLTEQVKSVCDDIRNTTQLSSARAVNALGFSQGGVFVRGLAERCNAVTIKNIVTFGSPHSGISEFAECADSDWWCKIWSGTLKSNTWGSFAQNTLVPAQYFRDPEDIENFLEYSNFLADINNERNQKAKTYKKSIAALDRLVMYKFQDEEVIHPPESSWFAESNTTSGRVTKLKDRDLYKEDWLGLKELDEKGGLIFRTTPGKHMRIEEGALEDAFKRYFVTAAASGGGSTATKPWSIAEDGAGDYQDILWSSHGSNASPPKHSAVVTLDSQRSTQIWTDNFVEHYAEEILDTFT